MNLPTVTGPSHYSQPGLTSSYPPSHSHSHGAGYPSQYPHHPYAHTNNVYPPPSGYGPLPPINAPQDRRAPVGMNNLQGPPASFGQSKRIASGTHPAESPAKKKQSKWSAEEDAAIIELRGNGMKWEDISKNLPGRSAISCRLRFQNYLERRSEWDEEKKNKLARLYERFKKDMWEKIAKEMQLPWRAAEAMHWQIGEIEMASRANVPVFHLAGQSNSSSSQTSISVSTNNTVQSAETRSNSASPRSNPGSIPSYQQSVEGLRDSMFQPDAQSGPLGGSGGYRRNSDASTHSNANGLSRGDESTYVGTLPQRNTAPPSGDPDTPSAPRQYLSPFGRPAEGGTR